MVLLARYVCWGSSLVSGMGTLSSCKKHTTSCSKLYGTVVVFLPKWKFCSRTMIWKTPDNPPMFSQNECPSQRSDLNLTEMLWHNLKQAVNSKQTNKQTKTLQYNWIKTSGQRGVDQNLSTVMWNIHCQLLQFLAQPFFWGLGGT